MHLVFGTLLLFAAAVIGQDISFISPGPLEAKTDPSQNIVHPLGSAFALSWTAGPDASNRTSLVLFQYNGLALQYPFEYITQSVQNVTTWNWIVTTDKNLSISNQFLFNIFYNGESSPVAASQTFNISDTSNKGSPSSSSSTTSSRSSIASSTSSIAPSTSSSTAPAASSSPPDASASDGLSTDAKAGLGIGVAAVALIGITAGYFLFRRRHRQNTTEVGTQLPLGANYIAEKPLDNVPATRYEMSGDDTAASTRYEIYTPDHR